MHVCMRAHTHTHTHTHTHALKNRNIPDAGRLPGREMGGMETDIGGIPGNPCNVMFVMLAASRGGDMPKRSRRNHYHNA